MNATFKTVMLWMSLLVVVFLAWHFAQFQKKEQPDKFSEFMAQVEGGQVADVTITGNEIKGHTTSRDAFRTFAPLGYDKLTDRLLAKNVVVTYQPDTTPTWANMLISWAPFLLLIGFWVFFMRQMQSGGNKALSRWKFLRLSSFPLDPAWLAGLSWGYGPGELGNAAATIARDGTFFATHFAVVTISDSISPTSWP